MPIILARVNEKQKWLELTDKGYCSTKSLFYYGLKLHALAFQTPNRMPFPEQLVKTQASENDLNVF